MKAPQECAADVTELSFELIGRVYSRREIGVEANYHRVTCFVFVRASQSLLDSKGDREQDRKSREHFRLLCLAPAQVTAERNYVPLGSLLFALKHAFRIVVAPMAVLSPPQRTSIQFDKVQQCNFIECRQMGPIDGAGDGNWDASELEHQLSCLAKWAQIHNGCCDTSARLKGGESDSLPS